MVRAVHRAAQVVVLVAPAVVVAVLPVAAHDQVVVQRQARAMSVARAMGQVQPVTVVAVAGVAPARLAAWVPTAVAVTVASARISVRSSVLELVPAAGLLVAVAAASAAAVVLVVQVALAVVAREAARQATQAWLVWPILAAAGAHRVELVVFRVLQAVAV